jgi:hypothetical protein
MIHFVMIWYIFPVLVSCAKKNLATPDLGAGARFNLSSEPVELLLSLSGGLIRQEGTITASGANATKDVK